MVHKLFGLVSTKYVDYEFDLKRRLKNLPRNIELKFPIATAKKQNKSAIIILYDKDQGYVFIQFKTIPGRIVYGEIIDIPESIEEMVKNNIYDQLELEVKSQPIIIGPPKIVQNSHPQINGKFYKHVVLVTKVEGLLKPGSGFWVKSDLLPLIFAPDGYIPHPQAYAYNQLKEYLSR